MPKSVELNTEQARLGTVIHHSPEARRQAALRQAQDRSDPGPKLPNRPRSFAGRLAQIIGRVWTGVNAEGTIHAGNFAYMVLSALFPFLITGAALFSLLGEQDRGEAAVNAVLRGLPPVVADLFGPVAQGVIAARTGSLLWIGGIFGLWSVSSLVETIRDILRRAYGTQWSKAFWLHRLVSTGLSLAAVALIVVSIAVSVAIGALQEMILVSFPQFEGWMVSLALSRFVPGAVFFASLWLLFISLTPGAYRAQRYPKWPGALLVTGWWLLVTTILPKLLRSLFSYDLTYGSLAGVMIALFFFWLMGLGIVIGAELNAALAETPEEQDIVRQPA